MSALEDRLVALRGAASRWRRSFDTRVRRERILLIGAAAAAVVAIVDQLWLTPAFDQWKAARARQVTAAGTMQRLNQDIAERGAQARAQEQQLQQELAQARERLQQGDTELRQFGSSLVGAADMLPVLDRMLVQTGGLRLRSMQSLARTELASAGVAAPSAAASAAGARPETGPTLYRHGVELTVEGGYAELLAYLHALEAMPQRVLWGGVQMKVEQYPKALLTLRVYTLSLDRGWLEL
jgi:MSHA biogenesis protein MshJ